MNIAVIAVRGGPAAKSRLSALLDTRARQDLIETMLEAMLIALRAADIPALVVSPTPALLSCARQYNALCIKQNDATGLNGAFRQGCSAAFHAHGAAVAACLPGDLPLLDARDVETALAAAAASGAAIAASRSDNGTGALVLHRDAVFAPAFGRGSYARHLANAKAASISIVTLDAPSLATDIDTPEHLTALSPQLSRLPGPLGRRYRAILAPTFAEAI